MKNLAFLFVILLIIACAPKKSSDSSITSKLKTTLTKTELQDKIKGGWAGQVIGCTYGGPTEFRYKGTMINDSIQSNGMITDVCGIIKMPRDCMTMCTWI